MASSNRFGSVGIFSVAVIAFALATLAGCAAPGASTSKAREPAPAFAPGFGALRADSPPPPVRIAPDRQAAERGAERAREPRSFRPEYCRRCN